MACFNISFKKKKKSNFDIKVVYLAKITEECVTIFVFKDITTFRLRKESNISSTSQKSRTVGASSAELGS